MGEEADRIAAAAEQLPAGEPEGAVALVAARATPSNPKQLLEIANRIQSKLGGATAVVLGGAEGEKVGLVALFSKQAVGRGLSAGTVIREIAPLVGGGGGGRDDMAQAGGKDPAKLDEALAAARVAIERDLG